ncbi:outer membrane beta-barrel protein [Spirosoma sp. BT702]|uniref:Outer membrane beta-barrel protein n=1 Tax=Spirosoma profusum TaxID=2771354 RepID=A0A927AQG9_9BACT|nr:outer membrane beta-barrel protein [Spirosoma profusum]MBD2700453.1 outer membrane beta-barrel protein [Spirosoma profusum]
MIHSRFFFLTLAAGFLLSTATWAQTIRQQSTTEGFSLGLSGHYLGWSSDYFQFLDENSGGGPGFGVRAGYGFTQRYEVFAQYDQSILNADNIQAKAFQFSHVTGGLRFNFSATTRALRPFAELGYTYQTGKVDQVLNNAGRRDNIIFKGGALHVGAGLNYFVALPVAITLNGSIQAGAKSPVTFNGVEQTAKADVAAFRISLGVIVYVSELF